MPYGEAVRVAHEKRKKKKAGKKKKSAARFLKPTKSKEQLKTSSMNIIKQFADAEIIVDVDALVSYVGFHTTPGTHFPCDVWVEAASSSCATVV